eukprot:179095_1
MNIIYIISLLFIDIISAMNQTISDTIQGNAADFATDVLLQEQLTGQKYKAPAEPLDFTFTIDVESAWLNSNIIKVTADDNRISDAKWVPGKAENIAKLFKQAPCIPNDFHVLGISGYQPISKRDNRAILKLKCQDWESGCSSQCSVTMPIRGIGYLYRVQVHIEFRFYTCHDPSLFGTVNGNALSDIQVPDRNIPFEPRISQSIAYTQDIYDVFSTKRTIPTTAAMTKRQNKKTQKKQTLHKDYFVSVQMILKADCQSKHYKHLPPPYQGSFHGVQKWPTYKTTMWNEQTSYLALKIGKCRDLCLHIDTSEGIVDKIDNEKAMSTMIVGPSPACQESIVLFDLITTTRHQVYFEGEFVVWFGFLKYLNNDKTPRLMNWMSDCYSGWSTFLCGFLNKKNIEKYLCEFRLMVKNNSIIRPINNSYFYECVVHIRRDFKRDIQNNSSLSKRKKNKILILMHTCVSSIINVSNGNKLTDFMNEYNLILTQENFT